MWRPKGWFEIRGGSSEHSSPGCKCRECMSYEEGADAILEALGEKGLQGEFTSIKGIEKGLWVLIPEEIKHSVSERGIEIMRYMTTGKKILSSLQKSKRPVTIRRISGWHYNIPFGSIYQTVHRLKRAGYIREIGKDKFAISDEGSKELQWQLKTRL